MPINTAKGYAISDVKNYKNFEVKEYPLKTEEEYDVTIEVECCGEYPWQVPLVCLRGMLIPQQRRLRQ